MRRKSNGAGKGIAALIFMFLFFVVCVAIGSVIPTLLLWGLLHFAFGFAITYVAVYWFIFLGIMTLILLGVFFNA